MAMNFTSCGSSSSSSSSGFTVKGTLASTALSSISAGKDGAAASAITDVLAVNPRTGNVSCKTATVGSDGKFEVEVTNQSFWSFFFFNRLSSGTGMLGGWFRSSWMNGIVPNKSTGTADLGTVTIDTAAQTADTDQTKEDLLEETGLDSTTADEIGTMDNEVGRYSNADTDNDGLVDCDESNHKFMLDFHVRYDIYNGAQRTKVSDIIGSYYDTATTTFTYASTGIYVAYPTAFSSLDTGSVKFVDTDVITSEGGAITKNTSTSSVTTNNFTGYKGFGSNLTSTSTMPQGTIIYAFGDKTLTFTKIETPTLAEISASTNRIFPFIKLNKTDTGCTSNCTLASIDYKWMKKTATSWTDATTTEISLITESGTGVFSFYVDNTSSGKYVSFVIPSATTSGTILWQSANASLTGITATEFTNLVTTQICNIGLSYDDKFGMRYFQNINDATGTCS